VLAGFAARGVCLLTLAPERVSPGAIGALCEAGVIVSLGHTNASADCARQAADEGATGVTHLFNAMSQMSAREPGLVGAAFMDDRFFAGLIADGVHVAPMNLRLAHRIIGHDRLMLVSDAMPSVGARAHSFNLMGRRVELRDGRLALPDRTLAGAHLTLAQAVKRMVHIGGASLESALTMATRTPARFLGLEDAIGVLRPGAFADLIALDAANDVARVWLRGHALAPGAFDKADAS
ncbi:MAG: amidohydrolase family protein, partial [Beijerinckiaceae bacterium]|nr:amidohydrolase family protein [Beijerinckiaceae bacterium]